VLQIKAGDQRSYMLFGRFSFFFFFCIYTSLYGDFEKFQSHFSAPVQQFKSKKDLKFQRELKQEWKGYKTIRNKGFYASAKLKEIPKREVTPVKKIGPLVFIENDSNNSLTKQTLPSLPFNGDTKVDFFGLKLYLSVNTIIKEAKFYPYNQDGIASYFSGVVTSNYKDLIKEIKLIKKTYHLNDWGVYQLLDKLSLVIYKYDDERELFKWFFFQKLGYNVKIALAGEHVYSIYEIKQKLYNSVSVKYRKKEYFFLTKKAPFDGLVYIHKEIYNQNAKALDLRLKTLPLLKQDYKTKKITFDEYKKKYTVSFTYNKNMIDFYHTYPQTEFSIFLNAPMERITYNSLVKSLKDHINGMKTNVALNFLLHFVQKGFIYQRDKEHFGKEKILFAEETLFYNSSDCEDRVTLYGYLVKKLFNIGIYAIKYSNYMVSSLYIPINGDSYMIGSKRYIIADPTYINANVGISMPNYKGRVPRKYIHLRD